jgi:hypothetical protein
MTNVMTIREAVQRAKAEGLPVTEYTLRRWIKTGAIPVRTVGSKVLLFYPNLTAFLRCENGADNAPATVCAVNGIRPVNM